MSTYADRESSTADYARRFAGPVGEFFLNRQAALLQNAISRLGARDAPLKLIDVGGGHAQIARVFYDRPGVSFSVIVSATEAIGQIHNLPQPERITVHIDDLCHTKLPARSFDGVMCIRLLPHCESWRELIAELCRLSSGAVIIDYPPCISSNIFSTLFFPLKKRIEKNTRRFRLFSHREIEAEFASHGFEPAFREGQFFMPMVLYRLLGSRSIAEAIERVFLLIGLTRLLGSPTIAMFTRAK